MIRRRIFCTCGALSLLPSKGIPQSLGEVNVSAGCAFGGPSRQRALFAFASDREAVLAIEKILAAVGARQNFQIFAGDVANAEASVSKPDLQRFIFYSQYFMERVRQVTKSDWGPISILAHEVGHHINGDPLDINGTTKTQRHTNELEADRFSGSVLHKLGASIEESLVAIRAIADPNGSETHPALATRVAAITNGWRQSADILSARSRNVPSDSERPSTSTEAPSRNPDSSNGTCEVILSNPNARVVGSYSGQCLNGLANGDGRVEVWFPPSQNARSDTVTSSGVHLFIGKFRNGRPSGYGQMSLQSGSMNFTGIIEDWKPIQGGGTMMINGALRDIIVVNGQGRLAN